MSDALKSYLPWTASPLIINAPMAGFAGGALASAVTLSGGLGLIGGLFNMDDLRAQLKIASEAFKQDSQLSSLKTLPVGVGLLPFVVKIEDALPVIKDFRPTVIWLFAAKELDDYAEWAKKVRSVSPETKIWIQVGSVAAALQVAKQTNTDALCLQGADAGGHGFEKGAGIISLLPETSDTLARNGFGHISLVASGGVVDGRGVAAAYALGAHGVVMGTRFLASKEVAIHPKYQAAVLEARDGGQATTRSKLFDELRGPNIWPELYDGRSLVVKSYADWKGGMGIEEIRKLHNQAVEADDKGFQEGLKGRAAIWAGTGVGLVNEVQSAGEIARSARDEAKGILERIMRL